MWKKDGQEVNVLGGVTVSNVFYPAPVSRDRLLSLGFIEVADPVTQRMDDRFYWNGDPNQPKSLDDLRPMVLVQIKQSRQAALDTFTKSSGISAVYSENLLAAQRFQAADTTVMRDGRSPEQYLAAMGSKIGMDVATFVAYIMSENEAAAQKCAAIEEAYLEHAYLKMETITFEGIQTLVLDFQAALELIVNPPPAE